MILEFSNGKTVTAAGGSVSTLNDNQSNVTGLGQSRIGQPSDVTVGVKSSASTTITINVSYDGVTWLAANIRNTNTPATLTLSANAGQSISITPAPYVQLVTSNACAITAWCYTQ